MKYLTLTLLGLFLTAGLFAQDFYGKAIYMSKTKIEINLEGRNIPEARKKQIMERMKSMSEKTFELDFDRSGSLYQEQAKLETPGAGTAGGVQLRFAGANDGIYYKNVQQQAFVNQTELFGKIFLVSDSLNRWEWKLGSESKKIGNYTCYQATATRVRDTSMVNVFRRMAQRNQAERRDSVARDSISGDSTATDSTKTANAAPGNSLLARLESEPLEETITAWFTPEIPVSQGPGPYWGLPGLILEVNDGRTALLCTQIQLNPEQRKPIEAPAKGKVISQADFDKVRAEKMEEMSERWRSGDRRNGGGSFRIGG